MLLSNKVKSLSLLLLQELTNKNSRKTKLIFLSILMFDPNRVMGIILYHIDTGFIKSIPLVLLTKMHKSKYILDLTPGFKRNWLEANPKYKKSLKINFLKKRIFTKMRYKDEKIHENKIGWKCTKMDGYWVDIENYGFIYSRMQVGFTYDLKKRK